MGEKIRPMKVIWREKNSRWLQLCLNKRSFDSFQQKSFFQAWLTKTESGIANEDSPSSLAEAEKLLSQHQQIREEIDSYTNDYR